MDMSGKAEKAKDNPEELAGELMTKPGLLHEQFAQMFYLGRMIGRREAEQEFLEKMHKHE